jgi:hypothetical protein
MRSNGGFTMFIPAAAICISRRISVSLEPVRAPCSGSESSAPVCSLALHVHFDLNVHFDLRFE